MTRKRVVILAAFLAATGATLAACGSTGYGTPPTTATAPPTNNSTATANLDSAIHYVTGTAQANNAPSNTGDTYNGPTNSPAAMKWVQLTAGAAGPLNPVVINGAGFTLYRFDKDTAHPSTSNCTGTCATTWPPVLIQPGGRIFLDGLSASDVSTIHRADGSLQVTIGGWPVYKFSKDTAPGQANGQGVDNTWYGVAPTGTKATASPQGSDPATDLNYTNGTAKQNNAPPNTGDFFNGPSNNPAAMKWVQLTAGSANGLDPIVHNGLGFTFYRFDKDTAHPTTSNCTGTCATTWPPVLVQPGGRIFVNGVPTAEIGILSRPDGTRQVTIGGWPIYRYSGDTSPGQTNGEGIGGTWYAVSPTGAKTLPPAGSPTSTQPSTTAAVPAPSSTPAGLGNGTVILDSGTNFTEPSGSEGVGGPGCKELARPDTAKSLQLAGGPIEVWTGSNCTGTSAVVTGDVPDLSTIGFSNKITSILFGS